MFVLIIIWRKTINHIIADIAEGLSSPDWNPCENLFIEKTYKKILWVLVTLGNCKRCGKNDSRNAAKSKLFVIVDVLKRKLLITALNKVLMWLICGVWKCFSFPPLHQFNSLNTWFRGKKSSWVLILSTKSKHSIMCKYEGDVSIGNVLNSKNKSVWILISLLPVPKHKWGKMPKDGKWVEYNITLLLW